MGLLIMANEGRYTNLGAVNHTIRYITRTRKNENRRNELICFGGSGIGSYLPSEEIIHQICYVQKVYNINARQGRRMYHEFFLISPEEFEMMNGNWNYVQSLAEECCQIYYSMGFQVVYAVHYDLEKKLHIHFCVSTINFHTGRKWHSSKNDLKVREAIFNGLMQKYQNIIVPLKFVNEAKGETDNEKGVCCM